MSVVDELIKKYPSVWELAQEYPSTFLTYLAEEGVIEERMIEPYLAQHRLAEKIEKPEAPRRVLLKGPSAVYDLIDDYRRHWERLNKNTFDFIDYLVDQKYIIVDGPANWRVTFKNAGWEYLEPPVTEAKKTEAVHTALYAGVIDYFVAAAGPVIDSLWAFMRKNYASWWDLIWGHAKSMYDEHWPKIKAKLEDMGTGMYKLFTNTMLSVGEVTPEKAPELCLKMFGVALGAGIAAHGLSVGFEAISPLKSLGFHQMTAMIAQLGSFGPVAAATLGQVQYSALRVPMSYYVNKVTRSRLPDDRLLQIMAVKPDITEAEFRHYMPYHGYSDFWIQKIWETMFSEPRYFELKMLSEDEAATTEWLKKKVRRAGYTPEDTEVFVSSMIKAAVKTQRQDYYKTALNLFKEGYIERGHLNKVLDELELRPEASVFAVKGAELMYLLDTINDEIKFWTDSYLKDLVTEEELELQLSLLGVNRWRVDLKVRLARVRKYKKPAQTEAKELASVMNKARSKYTQGYVTLYRNDRIDIETLYIYLVEIGIEPAVAEATCFLEEARKTK